MSDIDNTLRDFLRTTRSMESNIVSVISDSNRDIEMILKELLVYLDATSKNLEKVQGSIVKFVKDYNDDDESRILQEKINRMQDTMEFQIESLNNKLVELETTNTKKILELVQRVGVANQKMLKQIIITATKITKDVGKYGGDVVENSKNVEEIRGLLKVITSEIRETKDNVAKNQDNLMTVINNMMDTDKQIALSSGEVESQKLKSKEEVTKAKLILIGKVVGILLGSGGIIYLLVDVLLKASGGN